MSNDFEDFVEKAKAVEVPGLIITGWKAWAIIAGVALAGFFLGKIF